MVDSEWFKEGLSFECKACGSCCKNHSNCEYVYVSDADIVSIAKFLCITRTEFISTYCIDVEGYYSLLPGQEACPFLEDNKCKIYNVRPKQCSTWPFWTENLRKATWETSVKECCPGIGKGQLYSLKEILKIATERDSWYSK